MPSIRILGTVFPIDVVTNMPNSPHGTGTYKATGAQLKWQLDIRDSNITFWVEMDKFDVEADLREVMTFAGDITGAAINLMALSSGEAIHPVFHRLLVDDKMHWFHCKDLEFSSHITAIKTQADYEQLMILAVPDTALQMVLRDITDTLRQSKIGPINAGRTLDGICNYFIPDGGKRKDGWPKLHAALNITERYVQTISELSKGPRHASWTTGAEPDIREVIVRAWIVANRFLEYRKRGDQALVTPEFPLLDLPQA